MAFEPPSEVHGALPSERLERFLRAAAVDHEFVAPGVAMPTVSAAAAALGVPESSILKTLVFETDDGTYLAAVTSGAIRVDRRKLAAAAGLRRLVFASPDAVRRVTGHPAGGVAPVGHQTAFPLVVDQAVLGLPVAWAGGGDASLLLRIAPADIVRLTNATVADIQAEPAPH
ncbi:MAG TPA: YbaK/EbsC family protein [Thermomicrobiales bacterium]|nr:YbaK/EbsC family protein [Thermomicrobiales bacterium]